MENNKILNNWIRMTVVQATRSQMASMFLQTLFHLPDDFPLATGILHFFQKMKRVKKFSVALEDPFLIVRNGTPRQIQAYLEERGVSANKVRSVSGFSLLHRAAEQGQMEICEVLLHFGAKIDERSARKR